MSQAEDLLNSLTEDEVAVYSVNPDAEPHIVINADKTVVIPEALKRILVQYEHNVETVTFDCPRYWDGHDLSKMGMRIVFQRPDGHREPHPVENLRIDDTDNRMIHFDWTISKNTTLASGNISITVCAKIANAEGVVEREWHTIPNRDLFVNEGMDCSGDEIVEQNPDIIESILVRLDIAEQGGASDEQIAKAVSDYLTENPVEKVTEGELTAAIESYFVEHPVEAPNSGGTVEIVGTVYCPPGSDPTVTETEDSAPHARKYILGIPGGVQGVGIKNTIIFNDPISGKTDVTLIYTSDEEYTFSIPHGSVTDEQIAAVVEAYMADHPVEVPDSSQNANKALIFTGAVSATYDGSKEVTVNIPSGGSGGGLTSTEKNAILTILDGVIVETSKQGVIAQALATLKQLWSGGEVFVSQTGTTLALENVTAITTITQNGTTLALA